MKLQHRIAVLFACLFVLCVPGFAQTDSMPEQEVAGLLDQAKQVFKLEQEDAVFLLDELSEMWTADGRRVTTVHQVVWISTEYGLDHYADLRIPWDKQHQTFDLHALRTWRLSDNVWIDAGATAEVETLPYSVDNAPDYCHLRETMLLHDGVELPCVMETKYTIADRTAFRKGMSGTHSLVRAEPTVVSRLALAAEGEQVLRLRVLNDAPQPKLDADLGTKHRVWTFEMRNLAPEPQPVTADSASTLPGVAWTTWAQYSALGQDLLDRVNALAVVDDAILARLQEELKSAHTAREKATRVAKLVADGTRYVDCPQEWWANSRPATRTWDTAYAGRIDRTTLALALFRAVGLKAELGFIGAGCAPLGHDLATIDWAAGPSLMVSGDGFHGWYDPTTSSLSLGAHAALGRPLWRLGIEAKPEQASLGISSRTIRLYLGYDEAEAAWVGEGGIVTNLVLSPFHRATGGENAALDTLTASIAALVPGAKAETFLPETFTPEIVSAGFTMVGPKDKRDEQGRMAFTIEPFAEALPGDLYEEHRESAVYLPGQVEHSLSLELDLDGLGVVQLPRPVVMENAAGRFEIAVELDRESQTLSFSRWLLLNKTHYTAAEWPQLRALLLANGARSGRVLYFE